MNRKTGATKPEWDTPADGDTQTRHDQHGRYPQALSVEDFQHNLATIHARMAAACHRAGRDPAVRRRFRHFVNSEAADTHVMFVESRGQIRPATPAERMQAAGMTSIKAA